CMISIFFIVIYREYVPTMCFPLSLHTLFRSPSRRPSSGSGRSSTICPTRWAGVPSVRAGAGETMDVGGTRGVTAGAAAVAAGARSEEHTSELQSRENLVCRLLLEKKNSFYDC